MLQEAEIKSCEHKDNAYIHCKAFPEMMSEKENVDRDYHGHHKNSIN